MLVLFKVVIIVIKKAFSQLNPYTWILEHVNTIGLLLYELICDANTFSDIIIDKGKSRLNSTKNTPNLKEKLTDLRGEKLHTF